MTRMILFVLSAIATAPSASAAILRVPQNHPTLQAAIDAASPGDTILVAGGRYNERIRLTPGVVLRSEGDDSPGAEGLRRAESTIIDGHAVHIGQPGVLLAEDSTLDGFSITGIGEYDDVLWKKHHDSHGEELGDEEGAAMAEGSIPAVSMSGISCRVTRCIVHHNGDVGIAITGRKNGGAVPLISKNLVYRNMGGGIGVAAGADAIILDNVCRENLRAGIGCRNSSPVITGNVCCGNVRAGIGCREGAAPVIRRNKCCQNRRAGIGIRMDGTAPVVEDNECSENELAGIGCRDGARPILRNNVCRRNKAAGIGCRDGASPLIVGNECRENQQAGIGLQGQAQATIQANRCLDNVLVAIGVTGGSTAIIVDNELGRVGGVPPIVAVREASVAMVRDNRIRGGGVAAVLVQGQAFITGNSFVGTAVNQGNAVWVQDDSKATIAGNTFEGYRAAVNASKSEVSISDNSVSRFQGAAIVVRDCRESTQVRGNRASSDDPSARVVDAQGTAGVIADNTLNGKKDH